MSTAIRYLNFDGLANFNTSDFLMKDNEISAGKNVYINKIGELEKVPGYSNAGDRVVNSASLNFLHNYYQPSASTHRLITGYDNGTDYILKYRATGNWDTLSATYSGKAGAELSCQNYLDKAFIVGHKSGTFLSPATIEGTTYTTSSVTDSDLLNMPGGKYIVRYRDLLYVLNAYVGSTKYPNRVYYCDDPVSGAITWTNTTNFLEFGYDDGDQISGGASVLDRLIVFKNYSMWKYDEYSVSQIAPVGCDSYRSIVVIGDAVYWFNRDGFWRWSGGLPELISNKMQPMVNAIDQTTLGNVVGTIHDGFEYRGFVGNVTFGGNTYTNAWFCFNTMTSNQYIRCTKDAAKSACQYVESGKRKAYFGDASGYVQKFATAVDGVYSDAGSDISSFFVTKNQDYGAPEDVKFTSKMTTFSDNPQGMIVAIDVDNTDEFKVQQHNIIKKNIQTNEFSVSGNRMRYKFSETGQGKSWKFFGFTIETEIKETT